MAVVVRLGRGEFELDVAHDPAAHELPGAIEDLLFERVSERGGGVGVKVGMDEREPVANLVFEAFYVNLNEQHILIDDVVEPDSIYIIEAILAGKRALCFLHLEVASILLVCRIQRQAAGLVANGVLVQRVVRAKIIGIYGGDKVAQVEIHRLESRHFVAHGQPPHREVAYIPPDIENPTRRMPCGQQHVLENIEDWLIPDLAPVHSSRDEDVFCIGVVCIDLEPYPPLAALGTSRHVLGSPVILCRRPPLMTPPVDLNQNSRATKLDIVQHMSATDWPQPFTRAHIS